MDVSKFKKVDAYLNALFAQEDEVLRNCRQSIIRHDMPDHSISPNQGHFLQLLTKMCNASLLIEIGTLGAYSTIFLARTLESGGRLISIEIDRSFAEIARQNIEKAGLQERIEILCGDAMEVLQDLNLEGEPVDLFFMDADKPNYIAYYNWAIKHARRGSLIIADNVIRNGQVLDEESRDEKVRGVRAYNEMLANGDKSHSTILQQVGIKDYDGMAISLVK